MTIIALLIAFVGFILLVLLTYLVGWLFGTVLGWLIYSAAPAAARLMAEQRASR